MNTGSNSLSCLRCSRHAVTIVPVLCSLACIIILEGCNNQSSVAPPLAIDTKSDHPSPASKVTAEEKLSPREPADQTPPVLTEDSKKAAPQFDPEQLKFAMVTIGTVSEASLGYGVILEQSSTGFDVITADHVLADRRDFVVHAWQVDNKSIGLQAFRSITIMHRSPDQDLAWLRVRGEAVHASKLSLAQPAKLDGQPAWTFHIEDRQPIFELNEIEKRVSAMRNSQSRAVSYWRLKSSVEPGLSGGGLVDAQGQWIGIASGNSRNQAHYIDQSEISQFLREAGLR